MLETSANQLYIYIYKFHNNVLNFHRPFLENYDIWDQLRIDGGSEFTLTSKMQEFYSEFRNDKTRVPVPATKSVNVSD